MAKIGMSPKQITVVVVVGGGEQVHDAQNIVSNFN